MVGANLCVCPNAIKLSKFLVQSEALSFINIYKAEALNSINLIILMALMCSPCLHDIQNFFNISFNLSRL